MYSAPAGKSRLASQPPDAQPPDAQPNLVTMINRDVWGVDRFGLSWSRPGRLITPPAADEIAIATEWLTERIGDAGRIQTPTVGSYSLKHAAERWAGHPVGNGAMIVALARLGYTLRQQRAQGRRLNVAAGVSWKWYRRLPESRLSEAMTYRPGLGR